MIPRLYLYFVVAGSLFLQACQQKCQPLPEQPFQSVVGVQWRMVSTSDPLSEVSNFTFPILAFQTNFTLTITQVTDNTLAGSPSITGNFLIDPEQGLLQVELSATTGASAGAHLWEYELGRDLRIRDLKSGNAFRFVEYKGVVDVDKVCTFD